MGDDDRLAALGERVAALEAESRHCKEDRHQAASRDAEFRREVIETAMTGGKRGAQIYMEGLHDSPIAEVQRELKDFAEHLKEREEVTDKRIEHVHEGLHTARRWAAGATVALLGIGYLLGVKFPIPVP